MRYEKAFTSLQETFNKIFSLQQEQLMLFQSHVDHDNNEVFRSANDTITQQIVECRESVETLHNQLFPPVKSNKSKYGVGVKPKNRARSILLMEKDGTSLTRTQSKQPDSSSPYSSGNPEFTFSGLQENLVPFELSMNAESSEPEGKAADLGAPISPLTVPPSPSNALTTTTAPLFEHFLVVGTNPDAGNEFASKIHKEEHDALMRQNNSIMRRIAASIFVSRSGPSDQSPQKGNYDHTDLNTNFGNGSHAESLPVHHPPMPLPPPPPVSTNTVATPTVSSKRYTLSNFASSATNMYQKYVSSSPQRTNQAASDSNGHQDSTTSTNSATHVSPQTSSHSVLATVDEHKPALKPVDEHKSALKPNMSADFSHYIENKQIVSFSESDDSLAHTSPEILFRFPPSSDPPPSEVCDFCLPLGGRLYKLTDEENEDGHIQEILYGQGQSKRSSRCFIFMLEDKTINNEEVIHDDECGINTGRLYGICVIHPRLLKGTSLYPNTAEHHAANEAHHESEQHEPAAAKAYSVDFESSVCYCFITRFPFFDFFFHVIFDIISAERLDRMETIAAHQDSIVDYPAYVRQMYKYLPVNLLETILNRLTVLTAPKYGGRLSFHVNESMVVNELLRQFPPMTCAEHYATSAGWALPILLSWMPIESLIWAIGMLMCEVKLIVLGTEPGMVSCAVMGLLALLQPLNWVAPLIPILPYKNIDFIESPVPIFAGLVIDRSSTHVNAEQILKQCNDSETGAISAVLDVSDRELYVSSIHADMLKGFLMPEAEGLVTKIKESLTRIISNDPTQHRSTGSSYTIHREKSKPHYMTTNSIEVESRIIQDMIATNINAIISMGDKYNYSNGVDISYELTGAANASVKSTVTTQDDASSPEASENSSVQSPSTAFLSRISTYTPYIASKSSIMSVSAEGLDSNIGEFLSHFTSTQMYHEFHQSNSINDDVDAAYESEDSSKYNTDTDTDVGDSVNGKTEESTRLSVDTGSNGLLRSGELTLQVGSWKLTKEERRERLRSRTGSIAIVEQEEST